MCKIEHFKINTNLEILFMSTVFWHILSIYIPYAEWMFIVNELVANIFDINLEMRSKIKFWNKKMFDNLSLKVMCVGNIGGFEHVYENLSKCINN